MKPVGVGSALPPAISAAGQDVASAAQQYVSGFLKTPEVSVPDQRFAKRDPNAIRLNRYWSNSPELCRPLVNLVTDAQTMQVAVDAAIQRSDTFEAGLAMGAFTPDFECAVGSKAFRRGFLLGQIHTLKIVPPLEKNMRWGGLALYLAGGFMSVSSVSELAASEISQHQKIDAYVVKPATVLAIAAFAYGYFAVRSTNLYRNDAVPSDKLITSGPFELHRNPYYAGGGAAAILTAVALVTANVLTGGAFGIANALLVVGGAAFLTSYHLYTTKRDERILKMSFGEEYRAYKKTTPRYFPAFWKIPGMIWRALRGKKSSKS